MFPLYSASEGEATEPEKKLSSAIVKLTELIDTEDEEPLLLELPDALASLSDLEAEPPFVPPVLPAAATSPEVVIRYARREATTTGLGTVRGVPTNMVGVESSLRELVGAYKDATKTNSPRVVIVSGSQGIGKTRLVFEFLERLRVSEYPFSLLTSFASSSEGKTDVIQRLLASRIRLGNEGDRAQKLSNLRERVREVFGPADSEWETHVLSAFYNLEGSDSLIREVQELHKDRSALRRATRATLERLIRLEAEQCPTILVVDDLEYDDAEGLIEVSEMVVKLKGLPLVAVLVGTEPDDLSVERLRVSNITTLELPLDVLSPAHSEELVRDILRNVEDVPEELVDMIVRKGGGIPLVIEQLVRLLIDNKIISVVTDTQWKVDLLKLGDADTLPENLEDLDRVRIEALSEDQQHVLQVASMLGGSFLLDDLVRILRLQPMDFDEVPWFSSARLSWTQGVLLELMGREIINRKQDEQGADVFEFKFPREQRYLLQTVDEELARTVHGCFALFLDERKAEASHVAAHLEAAGLLKSAASRWLQVGKSSERAFFTHSAMEAYTHALSLLGAEDGDQFLEALTSVGRVATRLGEFVAAETAYSTALQTAYALEKGKLSIDAYLNLGTAQASQGHFVKADANIRRAMDLASKYGEKRDTARCLERLAEIVYESGSAGAFAESLKMVEQSLEIRRGIGDPAGTADSLDGIGGVCIGRGDLNRAMACFSESLNGRRALDDWPGMSRTLLEISHVSHRLGQDELARKHLDEAIEIIERSGDFTLRARALKLRFAYALRAERFTEAESYVVEAHEIAEQLNNIPTKVDCFKNFALLQQRRGLLEEALQSAVRAVEFSEEISSNLAYGLAILVQAEIQALMIKAAVQPRPSLTHTRDLFLKALNLLEEMGNWHGAANALRGYGEFLRERGKEKEAKRCLIRAEKLDPLSTK